VKAAGAAPRRRVWPWLVLVLGIVIGLLLVLDEATWLRPLLQQHVLARSQRHVHFDALHFGLSRDLEPTVRLRGLRIENAPWADRRPMVVAGEVRFTFAWRSLTGEHIIVNRLELLDAQVDLEHRADGLRNWRLTRPDDRGPGKIRVLTLDARRSSLRLVQGSRDLEIDAAITALDTPVRLVGHESLPLTKQLTLRGTRSGQPFDAALQVSDVLSFLDSAQPFAVRGDARSLRGRLHVEGSVTDLAELGRIDVQVALSGASLAELSALLQVTLPASRAFAVESQVRKSGPRTEFDKLAATLGRSDVTGELSHVRSGDAARRTIDARLASKSFDLADLPLSSSPGEDAPLDAEVLKRVDAKLAMTIDQLKTPWPLLQARHARLTAALAGGVLAIDPLRLEATGGTVTARATFDANPVQPRATLKADLDGIRLDQLLPPQAEDDRLAGTIGAHAELQASGTTRRMLLQRLAGTLTAATSHVSISSRLDARLALNGGRVLRTMLEGTEQIPVRCGVLELRIREGIGQTERLVIETDAMKLVGTGRIDLPAHSLALTLRPQRKQAALLALDRSIRVVGPLNSPRMTLDAAPASPPAAAGCL
jgi:uncharacterized protein involved in outer membrane biogenesis